MDLRALVVLEDMTSVERVAWANGMLKMSRIIRLLMAAKNIGMTAARDKVTRISKLPSSRTRRLRGRGFANGWYAIEDLEELFNEEK
jgi:hypothetical protein